MSAELNVRAKTKTFMSIKNYLRTLRFIYLEKTEKKANNVIKCI